jgi:flagellar assembly protein FliH
MSFVTVTTGRGPDFVKAVLAQDAALAASQEAELARRVRSEVAKLRHQVEAEARAAAEAAFRAESAPQTEALNSALAALNQAWGQLAAPLAQKEHDLAELVTELAFLLAKHIIGAEAAANPASLHALLTQLLEEAAAERGPRQTLLLRVNPTDHAYLSPRIPAEVAHLLADEKIAAGGALLEIITPDGDPIDKIEWDATLSGRLETLRTALTLPGSGAP